MTNPSPFSWVPRLLLGAAGILLCAALTSALPFAAALAKADDTPTVSPATPSGPTADVSSADEGQPADEDGDIEEGNDND
jgi:hypothetical protein